MAKGGPKGNLRETWTCIVDERSEGRKRGKEEEDKETASSSAGTGRIEASVIERAEVGGETVTILKTN